MLARAILFLIVFLFMSAFLYLLTRTQMIWRIADARRKGLYPDEKKATLFDVRELIVRGEKLLAIFLYARLYQVSHKEAARAVDDLEKSIQEKKTKS